MPLPCRAEESTCRSAANCTNSCRARCPHRAEPRQASDKGRRGRRPLRWVRSQFARERQPNRIRPARVVEDADPYEISLAEFVRSTNQLKSVFPATCAASSEWACSTPQPRYGATALYPRPHSSSPNQSIGFDLVRSRSVMSLLSRLRGSKGYGACGDAASPSRRPSGALAPRDKREYLTEGCKLQPSVKCTNPRKHLLPGVCAFGR